MELSGRSPLATRSASSASVCGRPMHALCSQLDAASTPAPLVVQAQRLQLHAAGVGQAQQGAVAAVLGHPHVKAAQRLGGGVEGGGGGEAGGHADVIHCRPGGAAAREVAGDRQAWGAHNRHAT